jgi:hypothetical protein
MSARAWLSSSGAQEAGRLRHRAGPPVRDGAGEGEEQAVGGGHRRIGAGTGHLVGSGLGHAQRLQPTREHRRAGPDGPPRAHPHQVGQVAGVDQGEGGPGESGVADPEDAGRRHRGQANGGQRVLDRGGVDAGQPGHRRQVDVVDPDRAGDRGVQERLPHAGGQPVERRPHMEGQAAGTVAQVERRTQEAVGQRLGCHIEPPGRADPAGVVVGDGQGGGAGAAGGPQVDQAVPGRLDTPAVGPEAVPPVVLAGREQPVDVAPPGPAQGLDRLLHAGGDRFGVVAYQHVDRSRRELGDGGAVEAGAGRPEEHPVALFSQVDGSLAHRRAPALAGGAGEQHHGLHRRCAQPGHHLAHDLPAGNLRRSGVAPPGLGPVVVGRQLLRSERRGAVDIDVPPPVHVGNVLPRSVWSIGGAIPPPIDQTVDCLMPLASSNG